MFYYCHLVRANAPNVQTDRHTGSILQMEGKPNIMANHKNLALSTHCPLFTGENAAAYHTLLRRVSELVKPVDVLEENWLQDVVDLSWEVTRLRRTRADFLNSCAHRGLRKLLDGLVGLKESQNLTVQWAARNPEAIELVSRSLAAAGMNMNTVMAQTFAAALSEVERIDRLTVAAEQRRNVVLREIAEYRSTFAAGLRHATAGIEGAGRKVTPVRPALPSEASA
jgi:hypothetical protein